MNFGFVQAEKAAWNYIGIFKVSNISGKRRALVPKADANDTDMDSENTDSDEDDEDEENVGSKTPVLQVQFSFLVHYAAVVLPLQFAASDTGYLLVCNCSSGRSLMKEA